jgi:hypothetical protein
MRACAGRCAPDSREALHDPREDALVLIGIGHKALFANSLAIGKKSNTVDCPSPRQRRPQGVMQGFPRVLTALAGSLSASTYRSNASVIHLICSA